MFTKHPHVDEALSNSGRMDNGWKDRWMGGCKMGGWVTRCQMDEQVGEDGQQTMSRGQAKKEMDTITT